MPHLESTSSLAAGLLLLSSLALPFWTTQDAETVGTQENVTAAQAGELFLRNCISCHQPPDTRFATDRAWLNQVHDTA